MSALVPNAALRAALMQAGMTYEQLAEAVEVDPKTVARWVAGRAPHRRHRTAVAAALDVAESTLWPTEPGPVSGSPDLHTFYPNRAAIPNGYWDTLFDTATERIEILAYAAAFIHDCIPDFPNRLRARAADGTTIRLLFGDPDSAAVKLRGQEERIGPVMGTRCTLTWGMLTPILGTPGIEARRHDTTLYASIFRFDSTMLVNTHAYGAAAAQAPVLHLLDPSPVFQQYAASFQQVWDTAVPVGADRPSGGLRAV